MLYTFACISSLPSSLLDAIGAILSQRIEGDERMVAYASRRLSKAEWNYGISDKEGLAVVFGIKHFHAYLHGSKFTIETYHALPKALLKSRDFTGRLARWALLLQGYDCDIVHKPGRMHSNVDALTRSELMHPEPYLKFSDLDLGIQDNRTLGGSYSSLGDPSATNWQHLWRPLTVPTPVTGECS